MIFFNIVITPFLLVILLYHRYWDLSIVHIAQTCWIEKMERHYIKQKPLATTMRERANKMRPDGTAHRDDFSVSFQTSLAVVSTSIDLP